MRRLDSAIVLGAVLLLGGSLLLLQALSLLERATDIFWGSIFILGGLALLSLLRSGNWWPLLPGVSLLAVGALILLSDAAGAVYGGTVLLGGIAPAFWLVYLWDRSSHWWALIPAGALSTLAAVTLVSQEARAIDSGGVFFIGLATTFLLVALLARRQWGYYPAAAAAITGLLAAATKLPFGNYLWTLAMIAVGSYLLIRYFWKR